MTDKTDTVIHFVDVGHYALLYQRALDSGYLIYKIPNGVTNRSAFFAAIRATFPLDPPVVGSSSWDALSDSLWEGLVNLDKNQIAIFWADTNSMSVESKSDFETALLVLADVSEKLSDPRGTVGRVKDLLVVVQSNTSA